MNNNFNCQVSATSETCPAICLRNPATILPCHTHLQLAGKEIAYSTIYFGHKPYNMQLLNQIRTSNIHIDC